MKKVVSVYSAPRQYWVGDGFPVRSLFSYSSHGKTLSPFLLLDRVGPADFSPTNYPRGVSQHPHRGFDNVTIVYKGEIAHWDSTGQSGVIGPGDVQWMTAGSGILHEGFHSDAFTRSGGTLDMVQLWVNLPAKEKMCAPRSQAILNDTIPAVALSQGAGSVRVIAGNYAGRVGPARTVTPMNVWEVRLSAEAHVELPVTDGWNTAIVMLDGTALINGQTIARESQTVLLDTSGNSLMLEASNVAFLLLLSGDPIDEPIVGQGPFVMNTQDEIVQAFNDFNNGDF